MAGFTSATTGSSFQGLGTSTAIVLSFWSAILLSLPFWLKTTSITRLSLPADQVLDWEHKGACPVRFPTSLAIHLAPGLFNHDSAPNEPAFTPATHEIQQLLLDSLEIKSSRASADGGVLACTDWTVQVSQLSQQLPLATFHQQADYVFLVSPGQQLDADHGSAEQAFVIEWPELDASMAATPDSISAAVVQRLLSLLGQDPVPQVAITSSSSDLPPAVESSTVEQDPRVIQYTRNVRLVFSLMNQDSSQGDAWDSAALRSLQGGSRTGPTNHPPEVAPIMDLVEELQELHHFHVESQVQWFAPLHFVPTVDQVEVRQEEMVEEEYQDLVQEEVEVEVESEEDSADKAEIEKLVQTVDGGEHRNDAREVEALLGGESSLASSTATTPASFSGAERETPSQSGKPKRTTTRTVERTVTRTRMVPRVHVRQETRRYVEWDDLKVFVNSAEWSLSSTVSPQQRLNGTTAKPRGNVSDPQAEDDADADLSGQTHDLHFILYVPSAGQRPLLIRDPETGGASESSAWLIPQWGGVVLLNPDECDNTSGTTHGADATGDTGVSKKDPAVRTLCAAQIRHAMTLFAQQLEILLGFSAPVSAGAREEGHAGERESPLRRRTRLEALLSKRILENARDTVETLGGIVRLVEKIENLGVGEAIRRDVSRSIAVLDDLEKQLAKPIPTARYTRLVEALADSYRATTLASRAFFNPAMLGLLYFPDEHKYAVYTPLFGPLLVPLLVALIRCGKEWLGRTRANGKGGTAKQSRGRKRPSGGARSPTAGDGKARDESAIVDPVR